MKNISRLVLIVLSFLIGLQSNLAQTALSAENWKSNDKDLKFENYLEKPSLFLKSGTALLKNSKFENGVIEVDIAAQGRGGFAGIVFRSQSTDELEVIYLRLFKSGFNDAIQYTPRFYEVDCWQLYHRGYTANANFNSQAWTHLKIEVENRTARIYLNNAAEPNLIVNDLKRDEGKGEVGVWASGTTYFSNFNYSSRPLTAELSQPSGIPAKGIIDKWEVSQSVPFDNSNFEIYPTIQLKWENLKTETSGLLNLSRYRQKVRVDNLTFNHSNDVVYAKKQIISSKDQSTKMLFGYSDRAAIFLNGKIIFNGNSSFLSRDGQFLGAIGLNDAVYLDLKKGENELVIAVADRTAGWGLQAQIADPENIKFR